MSWDEETLTEIARSCSFQRCHLASQPPGVYIELPADASGRTIQITIQVTGSEAAPMNGQHATDHDESFEC